MTAIEHLDAMHKPGISPNVRTGQGDLPGPLLVSGSVLARVLAYLRGRVRSYLHGPAAGRHSFPDDPRRVCITELFRDSYRITESITAEGERAINLIGCTLIGGPLPTVGMAIRRCSSARSSKPGTWSADPSPVLASYPASSTR